MADENKDVKKVSESQKKLSKQLRMIQKRLAVIEENQHKQLEMLEMILKKD